MATDDKSNVIEIVIFIVGLLFSILAHCVAWAIYATVMKILERLRDCDDNMKSAAKLLEYSSITGSVLQLSAEPLRFDPDVNEFERDVAVLMLKDPQLTYTAETMNRPNKPQKPPEIVENKSNVNQSRGKSEPKQEPQPKEIPPPPVEEVKPKTAPKRTPKTEPTPEPQEEEAPGKKKFKPPPNITKADAKDPQYETLRGIGNELFAGDKDKEKKDEEKKEPELKPAKVEFKPPPNVQKADAKDPQYETLADVKDDIFKG
ncbi:hypothetical protein GCK32_005800 [Trichostrongylus colubriformis]|uniref:Uncharacterized protein n=1 Tax=Trichostrongylus colubriformis TaxID=6319 RepID=A0AAN8IKB2_TRICO